MTLTARPIMAAKTIAHDASPTHTHRRAKLVIALAWAIAPTAKLLAAYIPSGNTVDHRAGPTESRGHRTSAISSTRSHSIIRTQSPMAMSSSEPPLIPAMPSALAPAVTLAAASAAIPSAPPVIQ